MKIVTYVCDRCKAEIHSPHKQGRMLARIELTRKKFYPNCAAGELEKKIKELEDGLDTVSISLIGYDNNEEYELCRDCEKELLKFLKGENNG